MATILKAPSLKDGSKGVVVFTTQDRDNFIVGNSKLENRIQNLKNPLEKFTNSLELTIL